MGIRGGSNNVLKYIAIDSDKNELTEAVGNHTILLFKDGSAVGATPTNTPISRGNGNYIVPLTAAESTADMVDGTGSSSTANAELIFDIEAMHLVPAVPGSAMTLTAATIQSVADKVEQEIINEADPEKVLEAITNAIAAANPNLGGLTANSIAIAVLDRALATHNTVGTTGAALLAIANLSTHSAADVVTAMTAGAVPDAFKADLTGIATLAAVTAAQTALTTVSGTDRDAILTRGGNGPWTSGAAVGGVADWTAGQRAWIMSVLETLVDAANGDQNLTSIVEGDDWTALIQGLGDLTTFGRLVLMIKCDPADLDTAALVHLDTDTGLIRIAGAAPTATQTGTLSIDNATDGNVQSTLSADATLALSGHVGEVYWSIKRILTGSIKTLRSGIVEIQRGVVDATT